jgi:hypothetical protein
MPNRILRTMFSVSRLDPAEAEIWISVYPERLTSETVVRGRFTGPRCVYASTVEVAYPLREHSREYEKTGDPHIRVRALIPEPNLWDPISPFLYDGVLELWQGKECCEQRRFRQGLRALGLSSQGLFWNSRPLTLRGTTCTGLTEEEARALHTAGCNALVAAVGTATADIWELAERFGFLMIGRMASREQLRPRKENTSSIGWLVTSEFWNSDSLLRSAPIVLGSPPRPSSDHGCFVGLELDEPPIEPLPRAFTFVACTEERLPVLAQVQRPKLVLGKKWAAEAIAPPGILGWIDAMP